MTSKTVAMIDDLLQKTSRTFALAIPMLPDPCPRMEVATAYLLFRIADTFEDATRWPREERLKALAEFGTVLQDPVHTNLAELTAKWVQMRPCDNSGYMELIAKVPEVFQVLDSFSADAKAILIHHAVRTAQGMADFVKKSDEAGNLKLKDVPELKQYCYIVAGIVGELLTDLFVLTSPQASSVKNELYARAIAFGEALQLVNILKDSNDDAKEGRFYLPDGVPRSDIHSLAKQDIRNACEYVLFLQNAGAESGLIEFVALPVKLAVASLDAIEKNGPGAKIGRLTVATTVAKLKADVFAGIKVF